MNKLLVALPRAALAVPILALPALVVISASAAPRAPAEELVFRPTQGQHFAFVFESEAALNLTDMSIVRNGEDWEGELPGWTISQDERISFTDEIVEAGEGRVLKLRRTFDEISETVETEISSPEGSRSDDREGASELEGSTVVFTWDADGEEYSAAFEGDGDPDLLEELECRVDFTAFLPPDSVSKDDTWSVDAQAFRGIASPGGDLRILSEDEKPEEDGGISDQLADNLEGEILCKLAEVREEDGIRIAVIAIQAKLESHGSADGEFEVPVGTVATTQEVKTEHDLEGELFWNLSAGHALSIELAGSLHYQVDGTQELSGEHEMSDARKQTFEGTAAYHASVE